MLSLRWLDTEPTKNIINHFLYSQLKNTLAFGFFHHRPNYGAKLLSFRNNHYRHSSSFSSGKYTPIKTRMRPRPGAFTKTTPCIPSGVGNYSGRICTVKSRSVEQTLLSRRSVAVNPQRSHCARLIYIPTSFPSLRSAGVLAAFSDYGF